MVPTSSILKMFDIIKGEDIVSSYSTEQLKGMLYVLQNEDLTSLHDDAAHTLFRCFAGIISPIVNSVDMEKIIRLEDALIEELQKRGENPPSAKFS